jgi:predicted ribonuclease YlaK
MTWHELSTIITRVGYRSKIIFSGDWKQNDLIKSRNDVSGLIEFLNVARSMNEFTEFTFTTDDIVRLAFHAIDPAVIPAPSWLLDADEHR